MEKTIPQYISYLIEAEKKIKTADHLAYMTYSLVKDKKILLTILSELNAATLNTINAILQHDYIYKKIELTKSARNNLEIFSKECSQRYSITSEEIRTIKEIISMYDSHKKSSMEFLKEDKIIILSETLQSRSLTIEKIKHFLNTTKSIFVKSSSEILKNSY